MPQVFISLHLQTHAQTKPPITLRQPADTTKHEEIQHWTPFTALLPSQGKSKFIQVDIGVHNAGMLAADSRGLFWRKEDAEKVLIQSVEAEVVKRVRNREEIDLKWGCAGLARVLGLGDGMGHWWEVVEVDVSFQIWGSAWCSVDVLLWMFHRTERFIDVWPLRWVEGFFFCSDCGLGGIVLLLLDIIFHYFHEPTLCC
jgi:hypothetical protein